MEHRFTRSLRLREKYDLRLFSLQGEFFLKGAAGCAQSPVGVSHSSGGSVADAKCLNEAAVAAPEEWKCTNLQAA
jgi:hypothetical protein